MLFPAVVGDDQHEVGYARVKNVSGADLALGDVVVWDISGSVDGVRATKPAAATLSLGVGIMVAALATNAYGPAQAYGYRAQAKVTNHATQAITAGDILLPVDAAHHLARSGASDGLTGFFYAAEDVAAITTTTLAAAALHKVIIRAC